METISSHDQVPANQGADLSFSQGEPAPVSASDDETVPMSATKVSGVNGMVGSSDNLEDPKSGHSAVHDKENDATPKDDGQAIVDLKDDLWCQWPSESGGNSVLQQDPSSADPVQDPWASGVPSSTQSRDLEASEDSFPTEDHDPLGTNIVGSGDGQDSIKADPFADCDPWTAELNDLPQTVTDQESRRPTTLDLLLPQTRNPFESCVGEGHSIQKSPVSSPFQPQSSNPFQDQDYSDPVQNQSSIAFQTESDTWLPSALDSGFQNFQDQPKGSRSPNPFSPVRESNPFLQELDLLPENLKTGESDNLNKVGYESCLSHNFPYCKYF